MSRKVDHLFWILLLSFLAVLGIKIAAIAVPVYLAVLMLQGRFISERQEDGKRNS